MILFIDACARDNSRTRELAEYVAMEYNKDYTGERYREIARAMGVQGVDDMSQEEYRRAAIVGVRPFEICWGW